MALKDIQIPKADVPVGAGGSFAVRGLSTADIEYCVRTFGQDLNRLWKRFVNGADKNVELTTVGLQSIFGQIVKECPALVAGVLGLAADADEEDMKVLVRLPITVQVAALMQVATLTISVEGDPKKAIGTVISALGGMNGMLAGATQMLATSSTAAE